jgi:nitrogen regulatory protein P-II 1
MRKHKECHAMRVLIAVIQPTKLTAVRDALSKVGVTRMTICDAQGYGRQRGQTTQYRGVEYKTNLLRKIALEITVNDDFLDRAIDVIVSVARTGPDGTIGDGKIFVLPLDEVVDMGRDLRGPEAI